MGKAVSELIRVYGDPILSRPAAAVSRFDATLRRLVERMLRVQSEADAIGLAAVQVGVPQDVFTVDEGQIYRRGKTDVLINAVLVAMEGEETDEEGCLSFPKVFLHVVRPRRVAVTACDLEGNTIEREAKGMLARVYSHEIDHLQGRLMIDRVDSRARARAVKRMREVHTARKT
ncbi:MAG: peptide deformylase [candidate division Zixibacteria bacterium]|nr:peptide deformylase [candidate division Zixibacteria bacterium]